MSKRTKSASSTDRDVAMQKTKQNTFNNQLKTKSKELKLL
jgi:hypothetical protein